MLYIYLENICKNFTLKGIILMIKITVVFDRYGLNAGTQTMGKRIRM